MAENTGVEVEIAAPSVTVKSYFYFRSDGRHLEFGSRTTSGNGGGDIVKSGMVDNVG